MQKKHVGGPTTHFQGVAANRGPSTLLFRMNHRTLAEAAASLSLQPLGPSSELVDQSASFVVSDGTKQLGKKSMEEEKKDEVAVT